MSSFLWSLETCRSKDNFCLKCLLHWLQEWEAFPWCLFIWAFSIYFCISLLQMVHFIGTSLIAYHGPNRDQLRVFECIRWQPKEIDIHSFLMPVLIMTLLDSGSVIISAVFLWRFCRINIWVEYCRTIRNYWIHLAVWGGTFISGVSTIWNIDKKLFI